MSPEMKEALREFKVCRQQVARLKHKAVHGDGIAAVILVDAAIEAVRAVQDLWFEPSIYNPFSRRGGVTELAARREALGFLFHGRKPFPILRPGDSRQDAMLREIEFGPFKRRGRKRTDIGTLVDDMRRSSFQQIRLEAKRPRGIEGRVWSLPPLSSASSKNWTDTMVAWLWERHRGELTSPDTWLYKLAKPERELDRDRRKREDSLDDRRKKWKRAGGGEMGVVDATKSVEAGKKIARMTVTEAHIRNGLKAEIRGYLERNLS